MFEAAIDIHLLDRPQAREQPIAQSLYVLAFRLELEFRQSERLAHADNLVGRERARAHATLMAAAVHLRLDAHPWLPADKQRTDSLGPVHFVRRHRQQIDL